MAFDLDDDELEATKKLYGLDKESRINKFIQMYEEIKEQSFIIGSINKDFFFEFADCLLSNYKKQKQLNEELQQKINDKEREIREYQVEIDNLKEVI